MDILCPEEETGDQEIHVEIEHEIERQKDRRQIIITVNTVVFG